jgi:hypothetical protein
MLDALLAHDLVKCDGVERNLVVDGEDAQHLVRRFESLAPGLCGRVEHGMDDDGVSREVAVDVGQDFESGSRLATGAIVSLH